MHQHRGRIKILHLGKSFNSKKFHFFSDFCFLSVPVYGDRGLYGMAAKSWGISLKLVCQKAPNFFIGRFLKFHWRFSVYRMGAPLMPFGRAKAAA